MTKIKLPYEDDRITKYFRDHVDSTTSQKNQREIAREMGYPNGNIISMFKRGEAKIPFEKLPLVAKSLEVDLTYLVKLSIEQMWPDKMESVKEVFEKNITENELNFILKLRKVKDDDINYTSDIIEKFVDILKHQE